MTALFADTFYWIALADFSEKTLRPPQAFGQSSAESARSGKPECGVGAGRQELQFTRTVKAVVQGHGAQEYTPEKPRPDKKVPSEAQTPKDRGLRQPAYTALLTVLAVVMALAGTLMLLLPRYTRPER